MNFFYELPNELIEYIFNIVYQEQYALVLEELKERTQLRNNERIEELVDTFVNELIDDVLENLNHPI